MGSKRECGSLLIDLELREHFGYSPFSKAPCEMSPRQVHRQDVNDVADTGVQKKIARAFDEPAEDCQDMCKGLPAISQYMTRKVNEISISEIGNNIFKKLAQKSMANQPRKRLCKIRREKRYSSEKHKIGQTSSGVMESGKVVMQIQIEHNRMKRKYLKIASNFFERGSKTLAMPAPWSICGQQKVWINIMLEQIAQDKT